MEGYCYVSALSNKEPPKKSSDVAIVQSGNGIRVS